MINHIAITEGIFSEYNAIYKMIFANTESSIVLEKIVQAYESYFPQSKCLVLLLDNSRQKLMPAMASSLPPAYIDAINAIMTEPDDGSGGPVVYKKDVVIAKDIVQNPLWQDCKEPAPEHGLKACWSAPVFSHDGHVLGAFVVYYAEPVDPSGSELMQIRMAALMTGFALEHHHSVDTVKSKFLANMSHELRTPLNAVIGFSDLLNEEYYGPLNEKQKEFVRHIYTSSRNLLELINNIIATSRRAPDNPS